MVLSNKMKHLKIREIERINETHLETIRFIQEKIKILYSSIDRYLDYITNNKNKIEELKQQINQSEQT